MNRVLIGLVAFLALSEPVCSQVNGRSGAPFSTLSPNSATAIPCVGTVAFSEDFESGLGAWTIVDGDGLTPNAQTGLVAGWQQRTDYLDSTNKVAVTPAWYSPVGKSDDWLISGAVVLGSNPCLSWDAYSLDQYFKEAYEVRISTVLTGSDTTSFTANPAVFSTLAEAQVMTTHAVSLADYGGQTVRIAFRQKSNNRFVLALDNIKVTNVNQNDIGVYAFEAPVNDPGDTIQFEIVVANYGSDTVRAFNAHYSVEGGPVRTMSIDSIVLAPNGTYTFDHSTDFITDNVEAFYDFCAWTTLPNQIADDEITNDSLCDRFKSGTPVGREEMNSVSARILVYPNPSEGAVTVLLDGFSGTKAVQFDLLDLQGRCIRSYNERIHPGVPQTLDFRGVGSGSYLLRAQGSDGRAWHQKLILR